MNIIQTNFEYKNPLIPLDKSNVKYIVIHHPKAINYTPEQCHADHLANGWTGAGYNTYIRKNGDIYIMRGYNIGAQCQGYNSISFGVCFEGNFDTEESMNDIQFHAGVEYIKSIIPEFPNLKAIVPHSALYPTECPGKYFPMSKLSDEVYAKEIINMNHVDLLKKYTNNPNGWLKGIEAIKNINGNLGDLEIFKYVPELLEKLPINE